MDDEDRLGPAQFFATERVRRELALGRSTARHLSEVTGRDLWLIVDDIVRLVACGYVAEDAQGRVELTPAGEASVRRAAPPPPDGVITFSWVGQIVRGCAELYGTSVPDMMRAEVGPAVVARSRVAFALWARGWPLERIDEHFAWPTGWARRAVARWKRHRDSAPPTSGLELRAWRTRHGLTQDEAARRLGVSRRTVVRAEQAHRWSSRHVIGQA